MRLYQVQLETSDKTYILEVATDGSDAEEQARRALVTLIGEDAAQDAHLGAYADVGTAESPGIIFVKPSFEEWVQRTNQHTAGEGNMFLVSAGSKDGDGVLDVVEVPCDAILSEIYRRGLRPDDYLVVKGPVFRPLLANRRKCGCPEQYHGRYCPACHGTGYIPPLPHDPLDLCPVGCSR